MIRADRRRSPVRVEALEGRQLMTVNTVLIFSNPAVIGETSSTAAPVEIQSFELNPTSGHGKASSFSFALPLGKVSTALISDGLRGKGLGNVELEITMTGPRGKPIVILDDAFTNVFVENFHFSPGTGGKAVTETFTFAFKSETVKYGRDPG
jgi:type VI protein secretion system component Hcp